MRGHSVLDISELSPVAVLYHPHKDEASALSLKLCRVFRDMGIVVVFCGSTDEALFRSDMLSGSRLLISVGGDGTFLRVARLALSVGAFVWPVAAGTFNFIPEVLNEVSSEMLKLGFKWRDYPVLTAEFGANDTELFVNELVILKRNPAKMVVLRINIGGEERLVNGDGMIVSTSLGSTAYALSAGAPIVHPSVDGIVVVPVNPHGLSYRPLVLPLREVHICLERDRGDGASVVLDGWIERSLSQGQCVKIKYQGERLRVLSQMGAMSWEGKLFRKIGWGHM